MTDDMFKYKLAQLVKIESSAYHIPEDNSYSIRMRGKANGIKFSIDGETLPGFQDVPISVMDTYIKKMNIQLLEAMLRELKKPEKLINIEIIVKND